MDSILTPQPETLDTLSSKDFIVIKNARVHNLKNLSVALPRNKFIVITGLSGSGKSSLAFDTLYAEGQRRYVESLSSYARQFMDKMTKPEVDYIKGISPAIAIEQKVNTRNPRSTVGTSTEIYDYLKLLFARVGKTYSPVSGELVKRHTVTDIVDYINTLDTDCKVMVFAPVKNNGLGKKQVLEVLLQKGFTRFDDDGEIKSIEDTIPEITETPAPKTKSKAKAKPAPDFDAIAVLIDRFGIDTEDEDHQSRIADSIQTAFSEGEGECYITVINGDKKEKLGFNNRFECDGIEFEEPSVNLFTFNNPYGACKTCEGFGQIIGIDNDLVVPDKSLSIYEGAIACWRGETMKEWANELTINAYKFDFPVHCPYYDLSPEQKKVLWTGNKYFSGLNAFFKHLEEQNYKIQYRVMLSRYRGKTTCPDCLGSRLRKDASYVKVGGKSITEVVLLPVDESLEFFKTIKLSEHDQQVAQRLLTEILNRLGYLGDVGLGYLTLNRLSNTLSGGESQRINLATSLGSSLVGSIYILDEPSIGLHPRDTHRLIKVLKSLRDLGNTLIVVEHDEEIMHAADQIIDIGPMAGFQGGNLIFQGNLEEAKQCKESLTGNYLNGTMNISVPAKRKPWTDYIEINGARENNLKSVDVKFPLDILTVVTGVSGSGKTSLVKHVLYPALKKMHGGYGGQSGSFDKIGGSYKKIGAIEFIDQNPIGKSSRSNPVTYVKAWDEIRNIYSDLPLAKARRMKPSHFSFNVDGGRCEVCKGEGEITIEMQFMADIHLTCDTCHGRRFKQEVLEVVYQGKSVHDLLEMTIDEAIGFFNPQDKTTGPIFKIREKLKPLQDVGLGYLKLGQSSSTLSGGEAQRIKLAFFLTKGTTAQHTFFIFDEPTTGLHFHDIEKLMISFRALIDRGHSLLVIEHNLDVIKCADWIIDIGPDGGDSGGNIVFEGTPEDLVKCKNSHTGGFLKEKL